MPSTSSIRLSGQKQPLQSNYGGRRNRNLCRSLHVERYDGYRTAWNISAPIFLHERNHEYLVGGHAHRCSFTRHIQYDGTPTSTTVSMIFALLGGTFALAIVKTINSAGALQMGDLINTDKALQVIVAIFVSVAIAFFFGVLVQYIARLIFKFNYQKQLKYFGALFGGFAATSIIYFILIKGLKSPR